MRTIFQKRKATRGFTLIETFVAITILLTAITGPLTIASRGLSSAFLAKEQTTASYLAQEAIEYIRWKRDTNALAGSSWLAGLSACTSSACYVDVVRDTINSCVGSCPSIAYNPSSWFYDVSSSPGFTRTVQVTSLTSSESQIIVTVTWTSGGGPHTVTAVENIFNWQ